MKNGQLLKYSSLAPGNISTKWLTDQCFILYGMVELNCASFLFSRLEKATTLYCIVLLNTIKQRGLYSCGKNNVKKGQKCLVKGFHHSDCRNESLIFNLASEIGSSQHH